MKKRVKTYFESFGMPAKIMIDRNRFGLNRKQIEFGMCRVYERIQGGEEIRSTRFMSAVCREAIKGDKKLMRHYELEYIAEEDLKQKLASCQELIMCSFTVFGAIVLLRIISYLHKIGIL